MTLAQMGPGIPVFISEQIAGGRCLLYCFHCTVVHLIIMLHIKCRSLSVSPASPWLLNCRICHHFEGVLRILLEAPGTQVTTAEDSFREEILLCF